MVVLRITWCLYWVIIGEFTIITEFIVNTVGNRDRLVKNYFIFMIIGTVIQVRSQNNVALFNLVLVSLEAAKKAFVIQMLQ